MSPSAGGHFPESPVAADAPQYLAAHLRSPDPRLPSPIPERSSPPLQGTSSRRAMGSPPPLLPMPKHRHPQHTPPPYHPHHYQHHQNAQHDSTLPTPDHRLPLSATTVKTEPMDSPFQSTSSPWTSLDRRRTPTPPSHSSQLPLGIPALPKQEPQESQSDPPTPNRPQRGSYLHKILQHRIRHQMQPVEEESDIRERREREQQRQQQYLDAVRRLHNTEIPHHTAGGGQYPPNIRDSPKMRRYSGPPQTLAQYHSTRSSPPPHPLPSPVSMGQLLSGAQSINAVSTNYW